jgi:DNA-binding transcriptional LysR family regulator
MNDLNQVSLCDLIHLINIWIFIYFMKNIDHLKLDGHLLQLLVTVTELRSVSRAAEQLELTQSAVSHQLDRLRRLLGHELFVKSGRGIVPTPHAETMASEARKLIEQLRRFSQPQVFTPSALDRRFVVAANDLQRDLLLPRLLLRLRQQAPKVSLLVLPSDVPSADQLRDHGVELVISPRLPDAGDIKHRRLFSDEYRVFYDAAMRRAPRSLSQYLQAEHVAVVHNTQRRLDLDEQLTRLGIERRFAVTLSSFGGVAGFLQGTDRLATLPGRLRQGLLRGLADAPTPFKTPTMPMFAAWHVRHQDDPAHAWLRQCLFEQAS